MHYYNMKFEGSPNVRLQYAVPVMFFIRLVNGGERSSKSILIVHGTFPAKEALNRVIQYMDILLRPILFHTFEYLYLESWADPPCWQVKWVISLWSFARAITLRLKYT